MVLLAAHVSSVLGLSAGSAPGRAHHILIVDDEPDIRSAIKQLLERALKNVIIHTAKDGFQGLDILRAEHIDLILTDYKMPGMNGFEFVQEAVKVSPRTPRILITAFERELAEEINAKKAFDHIFTKPLDPRPLLKTCERVLSQSAA